MREVKIRVPETLSDIRLSQYQKFLRVTKGVEDEQDVGHKMVAVFCNLTDIIVRNMTKKSYDETLAQLVSVLTFDDSLPLIRTFKEKGTTYGIIPNFDDMTVGEIADIDNCIGDWQKMDLVMGVLFRPLEGKVRDKYYIEPYKDMGKRLDPPLDVALGAYFFLHNLLRDLLRNIPNSIKSIVQADPKLKSLVENGVGINPFMESLEEIFLKLRMSLT